MYRAGVIGHFGKGLTLLNGQTVKTELITEELEGYCREKVFTVDAHGGLRAVPRVIFGAIRSLRLCRNVILMLTENGLKVCVPILRFFNRFFGRRLHYVVVGGWLPEFVHGHPFIKKGLKTFHRIYVETNGMYTRMRDMGFANVCVMPNCKRLDIRKPLTIAAEPYRLCTFSRVMKEKGIEDAVNAVSLANKRLNREAFKLEIYGEIDAKQKTWFESLKSTFTDSVTYGGCVPPSQSTEVLKDCFALLFPTYYVGEGFAGTVIDAFSAGVPVIASDWKYNGELVKDDVTGRLFAVHDVTGLAEILVSCCDDPSEWNEMRSKCVEEAKKYTPEKVLKTLFDEIE